MKRGALLILCIFGLTAMSWAQGWGRGWNAPEQRWGAAVETVTVSGNLTLAHGMPAIVSDGDTFLLARVGRLAGFVDGLTEGAQVTVEGAAMACQINDNLRILHPASLTLGGRTYDLTRPAMAFGNRCFGAPNRNWHPRAGVPQRGGARPRGF